MYKINGYLWKNLRFQKDARYNWCLHLINHTFYGFFFSDKCTFYQNSLWGSRKVKNNEDNFCWKKKNIDV